jgi:hypothetical protein
VSGGTADLGRAPHHAFLTQTTRSMGRLRTPTTASAGS